MTVSRFRVRSGVFAAVTAVACATSAALALAPAVAAHHDLYEKVSSSNGAGNSAIDAFYAGTSADGTRAFFSSTEKMTADDADSQYDVFERSFGVTKRISVGAINGNGAYVATFNAVSADGTKVVFSTAEQLVAADQDLANDLYMRQGSTTKLISVGTGVSGSPAVYSGASADLSHVFFSTAEQIGAGDTDHSADIYEWANGAVKRVTQGPTGGNGAFDNAFLHVSTGGSRVLFLTQEKLTADDTDSQYDIYERANNQTVRVSKGAINGNGSFSLSYGGATPSGSHVFFSTLEQLAPTDTDSQQDVYDNNNGTVSQVSRGQIFGNLAYPAVFNGSSDDGSKVFFSTSEKLVNTDTDSSFDIYMRWGGATSRISSGQINGNDAQSALYAGSSADGSHVFFITLEQLVNTDTDTATDIYERFNNTTRRVSTGAINGNANWGATYLGTSDDGSRVFFSSSEPLALTDADGYLDIYERDGGTATFEVTTGFGSFDAHFVGATPDGRTVYFATNERILANDVDNNTDVYGAYER